MLSTGRAAARLALAACAGFLLALLGCSEGNYSIAVTFPSPDVKERVNQIRVHVLLSCASHDPIEGGEITLVKGAPMNPTLGDLEAGRYAIRVTAYEVSDTEICALAERCVMHTLEGGAKKTILVALDALDAPICEAIEPDDAGVEEDAGRDAGNDAGMEPMPDASGCVPREEVCNREDDDCDDIADETFDKESDRTNCGSCNNVCDEGLTCAGGRCAPPVVEIAPGGRSTCARRSNGEVLCWGDNTWGQLGNATVTERLVPASVANMRNAAEISSGKWHTCARRVSGEVACWGDNTWGQMANNLNAYYTTPTTIAGLETVTSLGMGFHYSCVVTESEEVYCWGLNGNGQLGTPFYTETDLQRTPTQVPGLSNVAQVDGGWHFTCARHTNGRVSCWGANVYGQLGDGTTTDRIAVGLVKTSGGQPLENVASMSISAEHACVIQQSEGDNAGTVLCWGANTYGSVGNGTFDQTIRHPVSTGITNGQEVAMGVFYSCARRSNGVMSCWGDNSWGQLGNGTQTTTHTPTDVSGLTNVIGMFTDNGDFHTCAIRADLVVVCWGFNDYGQLGNGFKSPTGQLLPSTVRRL